MSVSATSSTTNTSSTDRSASTGTTNLGKDDFLQLLVAEMRNQDPMNPMENKDMMAQLAQFNVLDQITHLSDALDHFMSVQELAEAGNLIGKQVEVTPTTGDPVSGTVSSASLVDGKVQIHIGDENYDLSLLTSITGGSVDAHSQG